MNSEQKQKRELLDICINIQKNRAEHAQKAMEDAQKAANEEEKSSAGDKYETARAMSQNLRDMNARQLNEALKDLSILQQIQAEIIQQQAQTGAVAKTSEGNFFIATSIGEIKTQNEKFYAVSGVSPIGQALLGKKEGDEFIFRGKTAKILKIF